MRKKLCIPCRDVERVGYNKKGVFAAEDWDAKTKRGGIFLHAGCREDYLQSVYGDYWLTSTWTDINSWKAWEKSPERQEIVNKIEPLLDGPEKVSIFSFVTTLINFLPPSLASLEPS